MSLREEQCKKVCRILDDVLANRPTERDSLIVAVQLAFEALSEPHWIPVTERLPKKSVEVLTCDIVGTIEVRSLKSSYDGSFYWESNEGECERLSDAIAWMPLPEPYKGVTT